MANPIFSISGQLVAAGFEPVFTSDSSSGVVDCCIVCEANYPVYYADSGIVKFLISATYSLVAGNGSSKVHAIEKWMTFVYVDAVLVKLDLFSQTFDLEKAIHLIPA